MSFIKSVLAFMVALILSLMLAAAVIFFFLHPSCEISLEKSDKKSVEHSAEELYAQYMDLSPVERIGKQGTLLSKAAHGGYLPAIRQMAREVWEGSAPEGMIAKEYAFWMKKAADLGDPEAQLEVFLECDMDSPECLGYLSRAAEQNHGPALLELGRLYAKGDATYYIAGNEEKALECYRRAAKANDPEARNLMYLLARLKVLPEAEAVQLNEQYDRSKEEAKQAKDGISPSFGYLENKDYTTRLLKTYLPDNEKVKSLPDRNGDAFGEND